MEHLASILACASLCWLILCVTGIVSGAKQPSNAVVTVVAAMMLSLYVFGHALIVAIR